MNNEINEKDIIEEISEQKGETATVSEVVTQNEATQEEAIQKEIAEREAIQKEIAEKRIAEKKLMAYTSYDDPDKRPTWIRVICIIAVVALVGLIIATLIAAIAGASKETIMALILCDGIIPIFIWVFLKITKRSLDRRKEAEKYYGQNKN